LKKSVALFITTLFLAITIFIINQIYALYENLSLYSNRYIGENNLILKNTIHNLNKISDKIDSFTTLNKVLNNSFFISTPNGELRAKFKIEPLSGKIDINTPSKRDALLNLLNYYQIIDLEKFVSLLDEYNKSKILNQKMFQQLLNDYYKETGDETIFKIEWEKYLFIGDGEDYPFIKELMDEERKTIFGVKKDDIIPFEKNSSFLIDIKIDYLLNEEENRFEIEYDINRKKVIKVEGYPIY